MVDVTDDSSAPSLLGFDKHLLLKTRGLLLPVSLHNRTVSMMTVVSKIKQVMAMLINAIEPMPPSSPTRA